MCTDGLKDDSVIVEYICDSMIFRNFESVAERHWVYTFERNGGLFEGTGKMRDNVERWPWHIVSELLLLFDFLFPTLLGEKELDKEARWGLWVQDFKYSEEKTDSFHRDPLFGRSLSTISFISIPSCFPHRLYRKRFEMLCSELDSLD